MRTVARPSRAELRVWARDYAHAVRRLLEGRRRGLVAAAYRAGGVRPSIVLIPGVYERWTFLRPVADVLLDAGYDVHAVETLGHNTGPIDEMARRVAHHLRENRVTRSVLVAHSKGGLIGKYLLAHRQGMEILGLVAINTPFNGSALARLLPLPTLRVFLPHSPELAELTAAREVNRQIVSIFGRFDPHIPGGSHLEGARNVQLETSGHFLPLDDPRVHRAILDAVASLSSDR